MSDEELTEYFRGMGWDPHFVSVFKSICSILSCETGIGIW